MSIDQFFILYKKFVNCCENEVIKQKNLYIIRCTMYQVKEIFACAAKNTFNKPIEIGFL